MLVTPYNRLIMAQPAAAGGGRAVDHLDESVGQACSGSSPSPPVSWRMRPPLRIAGRRQIESRRAIESHHGLRRM